VGHGRLGLDPRGSDGLRQRRGPQPPGRREGGQRVQERSGACDLDADQRLVPLPVRHPLGQRRVLVRTGCNRWRPHRPARHARGLRPLSDQERVMRMTIVRRY